MSGRAGRRAEGAAGGALDVARDGGIAVVTLNRPERFNALDQGLFDALGATFASLTDAKVVIVTGAGRAFCAGADIAEPPDFPDVPYAQDWMRATHRGPLALHDLPGITIAAVNGPAAGGGLGLALACDIRIAGPDATFRATFAPMGLTPDFGVSKLLPQAVGHATAMDLLLSCRRVAAQEAVQLGLAQRLAPDALAAARELAATIAAHPDDAARETKRLVRAAAAASHEEVLMNLEAPAQGVKLGAPAFRQRAADWFSTKGE